MNRKFATSCSINYATALRHLNIMFCRDLTGGGLQDEVKEDSIQDQAKYEQEAKKTKAKMLLPQLTLLLLSIKFVLFHFGQV